MSKNKQVTVRLPLGVIERVRKVAKVAGVTPTQVYVVLLAMSIETAKANQDRNREAG